MPGPVAQNVLLGGQLSRPAQKQRTQQAPGDVSLAPTVSIARVCRFRHAESHRVHKDARAEYGGNSASMRMRSTSAYQPWHNLRSSEMHETCLLHVATVTRIMCDPLRRTSRRYCTCSGGCAYTDATPSAASMTSGSLPRISAASRGSSPASAAAARSPGRSVST